MKPEVFLGNKNGNMESLNDMFFSNPALRKEFYGIFILRFTQVTGFLSLALESHIPIILPHTVDGTNPAPVDMVNIPSFIGFLTFRWCRISSINSRTGIVPYIMLHVLGGRTPFLSMVLYLH